MNYLIYAFFALIKASIILSKSISISSESIQKCAQSADIDSNDARDVYITNELRHDFCKSMHPTFESIRPVPPVCLSEYCNYESFKNPCAVLCYYETTNENSLVYGLGDIATIGLKTEALGNNCDDKCSLYNQPGRHFTEYRFNDSQKCAKNHYCDESGCCVRQTYETETSQFTIPVTQVLTTTTITTTTTTQPTTTTTTTTPVSTTAKSDEPTTTTQPTTTTTTQISTTVQPSFTTAAPTTIQTSPVTKSPTTTTTTIASYSTTSTTQSPEPSPTPTPQPVTIVTTETSSQTVITTIGPNVYSCTRVGLFRDPYDENHNKYYECALIASHKHCPAAQVFDPRVSHCVQENDASSSTATDITTITQSTTIITEKEWERILGNRCSVVGYFRNPYNCHKFYRCYLNDRTETTLRIVTHSCPDFLVFDEKAETCSRAEDTDKCDDQQLPASITSNEQNQSTTPTIVTTLSDENSTVVLTEQEVTYKQYIKCTSDGYFRDPFDCNRFYRCFHVTGEFSIGFYKCREGLVFEEHGVNSCILSNAATQCANKPIPLF